MITTPPPGRLTSAVRATYNWNLVPRIVSLASVSEATQDQTLPSAVGTPGNGQGNTNISDLIGANLSLGGGLRRRPRAAAEFLDPGLRLRRRPVVHGHLVPALFHEMSCHGETHHAETEKSDFSHVCYLVSCLVALGFAGDIARAGRCFSGGRAAP